MEGIEVVVAHAERATLRVGDVFLKIDSDHQRGAIEAEALAAVPLPVPEVLWHKPPVLALKALPGSALGHFGDPSPASPGAWAAAGAAVRALHNAPLPAWPGRSVDQAAARLDEECGWLLANDLLPSDVVTRNRKLAETALSPWTPVFVHGDLQPDHIFVEGETVTGVIDWSEAACGDAHFDLAVLTLGHPEHLDNVLRGYGADINRDRIRAWWSWRCIVALRWLADHGYGPIDAMPEVAVLLRAADDSS